MACSCRASYSLAMQWCRIGAMATRCSCSPVGMHRGGRRSPLPVCRCRARLTRRVRGAACTRSAAATWSRPRRARNGLPAPPPATLSDSFSRLSDFSTGAFFPPKALIRAAAFESRSRESDPVAAALCTNHQLNSTDTYVQRIYQEPDALQGTPPAAFPQQ